MGFNPASVTLDDGKQNMSQQRSMTARSRIPGNRGPRSEVGAADKTAKEAAMIPYLKVFGVDIGASEFAIRKRVLTIGRSHEADVSLANRSVSRVHATITNDQGVYTVEDAGSASGMIINGERKNKHTLKDGDSIEIAMYLLQFHTEPKASGTDEVAAQAGALLRGEYRTLPSNVRLRFRMLADYAGGGAATTATLPTEQGGLLVPTTSPDRDGSSLELELTTPAGSTGRLLGELAGIIEKDGTHWMCVRLHRLSKRQHEVVVAGAKPGEWEEVNAS